MFRHGASIHKGLGLDAGGKIEKSHTIKCATCSTAGGGAGGRTRTGTVSLPVDFESTTSANSITPAKEQLLLYNIRSKKSRDIWKFILW